MCETYKVCDGVIQNYRRIEVTDRNIGTFAGSQHTHMALVSLIENVGQPLHYTLKSI